MTSSDEESNIKSNEKEQKYVSSFKEVPKEEEKVPKIWKRKTMEKKGKKNQGGKNKWGEKISFFSKKKTSKKSQSGGKRGRKNEYKTTSFAPAGLGSFGEGKSRKIWYQDQTDEEEFTSDTEGYSECSF